MSRRCWRTEIAWGLFVDWLFTIGLTVVTKGRERFVHFLSGEWVRPRAAQHESGRARIRARLETWRRARVDEGGVDRAAKRNAGK